MGKMPLLRSIMLIGAVGAVTGLIGCNNAPQRTPYRPTPGFQGSQSQNGVLQNSTPLPTSATGAQATQAGTKTSTGTPTSPGGPTGAGTQPGSTSGATTGSLGNTGAAADPAGTKQWANTTAMGSTTGTGNYSTTADSTIHSVPSSPSGLNPIPTAPKPGDPSNYYLSGLPASSGASSTGMRTSSTADSVKQPSTTSLTTPTGTSLVAPAPPPAPSSLSGTTMGTGGNPAVPGYLPPTPATTAGLEQQPPQIGGTQLPMLQKQ